MTRKNNPVDLSVMSSEEIIEHYIVLMMKRAEDMKPDEVNHSNAMLLALLVMAQSTDMLQYRLFDVISKLEDIRSTLERKL